MFFNQQQKEKHFQSHAFSISVESLEKRCLFAFVYSYFQVSGPLVSPNSIATGPDGNIWFTLISYSNGTENDAAAIGEVNVATGTVTKYPTPAPVDDPGSIISGPGGDLWFTYDDGLGSINPATHVITTHPLGIANASPSGLAFGPDGTFWFTDPNNSAIGSFNPTTGNASEYDLPQSTDKPYAIVTGPDGDLWFTVGRVNAFEPTSGSIGKINPTSHAFTLFATQVVPTGITVGPDGNLWFNEAGLFPVHGGNQLETRAGEINPQTSVLAEYQGGGGGGIASGPFGSLWYTGPQAAGNQIGAIDPTTQATSVYNVPNVGVGGAIAAGPGNSLWFSGVGGYLISATVIAANQSAVAGYVYLDPTGTGTQSDGPLDSQTVFLDLKGDDTLDPGDPTANTNSFGYYSFSGLTPGTYTVRIVPYRDNVATYPAAGSQTVTASGGQLGSPGQLGMLPASSLIPLIYNPTPFGTANPDVQTAEVNGLYRLILNRAPDAAGGAAAISYLKDGGSLTQLATDLLTSAEYDTDVVADFYQTFLRRAPDSAGGAAAFSYLQDGGSLDGLAESLMDSAEYNALFPSDASFVQAIYGDILGRLSSTSEIAAGLAALSSGLTRPQYVSFLLDSLESSTRVVGGEYGIIFARTPDLGGGSSAIVAIQAGTTPVALAASLFGSAEFIARANATVG